MNYLTVSDNRNIQCVFKYFRPTKLISERIYIWKINLESQGDFQTVHQVGLLHCYGLNKHIPQTSM